METVARSRSGIWSLALLSQAAAYAPVLVVRSSAPAEDAGQKTDPLRTFGWPGRKRTRIKHPGWR